MTFRATLRSPVQELRIKVRPSRRGVRLDVGERFVYLTAARAREIADALHDAADEKEKK